MVSIIISGSINISIISCLSSGGGVPPISLSQIGSLNNTTYGFCILGDAFYRIDILSGQAADLYIYKRTATRETLSGRAADLYIRTVTHIFFELLIQHLQTRTHMYVCKLLHAIHE